MNFINSIQITKSILAFMVFWNISVSTIGQVSFCAVGDVLFDRGVRTSIESNSVYYLFDQVKDIISKNDLSFLNLECPLANKEDGQPLLKKYSFRADTSCINGLKYAGFNIACIANNHTIDYGKDAFLKTLELLKSNKILPFGGGKDQAEAKLPLLIKKKGESFAFFGLVDFSYDTTIYGPKCTYTAFVEIDSLCKKIREINSTIDHIIVSFHWGKDKMIVPTSRQVNFAHRVIDAGADLVLGHHPHVLQSIEVYHDKLILYSLGNFVFDQEQTLNRQGLIFQCVFKKGQLCDPVLVPIEIRNNRPELANNVSIRNIFRHLDKVSKKFKTCLFIENKLIKINY